MSARVHLICDGCARITDVYAGTVQELRKWTHERLGWKGGYVHRPYSGKRADFCPQCVKKKEKMRKLDAYDATRKEKPDGDTAAQACLRAVAALERATGRREM